MVQWNGAKAFLNVGLKATLGERGPRLLGRILALFLVLTSSQFLTLPIASAKPEGPAKILKKKNLTPEQVRSIQAYQRNVRSQLAVTPQAQTPLRPYSELEDAGYLFISSAMEFDSLHAKKALAQNLPKDVTLIVFADAGSSRNRIQSYFKGLIEPERLKIITLNGASDGFWARDGLPVPVWSQDQKLGLVDARYYHGFEPDADLGKMFHADVLENSFYFEGGNFIVNDAGDCVTIDNDLSTDMPTDVFLTTYGCKRVIRLPFEKGIGHADESVRFVNSSTLITDSANYQKILKGHGFQVLRVPRPDQTYETYINSLLVNGTIYVPIFNEGNDAAALEVYRSLGFTVVPIETRQLANDGLGSIHCITMTYPKVPFSALLEKLDAVEITK